MTGSFSHAEEEILLARTIRRPLGRAARERFAGASVAVTGAGGSIGAELARQLASCRPARLTLIDQSEHGLFQIERELVDRAPHVALDPVLADVTRASTMRRIFRLRRPQVVFHAAAYKHVTMAERAACAAAAVNVLGTAVATKRLAELITIAAAPAAHASVVRFGNVLGSSGSVLPLMAERIAQGRSIALTHPNATRYFMSVGEAVALVMRADALARGGETFWFEMGEPIRMADLVERLLRVSAARGLAPVPVDVIGLRPGEKLTEELTMQGADVARSDDPDIWVAHEPAPRPAAVVAALRSVVRAVARGDALKTLEALTGAVPEFTPSAQAWASARAERFYVRRDRRRTVKIA